MCVVVPASSACIPARSSSMYRRSSSSSSSGSTARSGLSWESSGPSDLSDKARLSSTGTLPA